MLLEMSETEMCNLLQTIKGHTLDLQRSEGNVSEHKGYQSPADSRGEAFGGLLGGQIPNNGGLGAQSQKLNSFCYLISSFNSQFYAYMP